ncbi:MAG: hypothetical protein K2O67_02520, partial [Clostridia bacterium]|nr:hypothetical protein [Clostridia bacterium]
MTHFNCEGVTYADRLFEGCSSLTYVDVSMFTDLANVTYMLTGLDSLESIKISDNVAECISYSGFFDSWPLWVDDDDNEYTVDNPMVVGGTYYRKCEHVWNSGTVNVEPSCSTDGEKEFTCTLCEKTKTEAIPATGHIWGGWSVSTAATCTTDKIEVRSCNKNCGATENRTVEDSALGHSFTNYQSNNDATCTQDGTKTATCSRSTCNETDTQPDVGSKLQHSFINFTYNKNATCTADGTETAVCSRDNCSETKTQPKVNSKLGHDFNAWHTTKQPTEDEEGEERRECQRSGCNEVERNTLPVLGHTHTVVTDAAVDPTCTETGKTEGSHCSACNTVIVAQQTLPANGHTAGAEATCTTAQTCTVCNTELAAALGHNEVTDEARAATCTDTGLTEGKHCSRCEEVLTAQTEVPALGHSYEWVITKDPTEEETGLKENLCAVCGDKDGEEEIAKLVVDDNGSVADLPTGHD